jgi:hypothetical protein
MAFKEKPSSGLLESFSDPLWERLGLTVVGPQWIVKGQHRGFDWIAIKLRHRPTGFLQTITATTFFVVRLPRKSKTWHLPADRITPGKQVCVDDSCVYAAALGEQPPVRTWRTWLDLAVDAAEEVIRTEGARRNESPQQKAERADAPSWNVVDGKLASLWLVAMAFFSFLNVMGLWQAYGDWQGQGAILLCHGSKPYGTYLQGWKAAVYAVSLVAPLPIVAKAVHTVATRMYRQAFRLQLCAEGLLWAGAMVGLHYVRDALVQSVRQAC